MGLFSKKKIINIEIQDISNANKKSVSSSITRGIVGGALFGDTGAMIGAMSGKEKTKTMITFLISYDDGTTDTITCEEGSSLWDMYNRSMQKFQQKK